MTFLVNQPDYWIGVPEYWPFTSVDGSIHVESAEQFAVECAAELVGFGMPESRTLPVLRIVARDAEESGFRHYVAFPDDPPTSVIARSERYTDGHEPHDPDRDFVAPPWSDEFTTASGIAGEQSVKHYVYAANGTSVVAENTYVFRHGDETYRIVYADLDLQIFERVRPLIADLASTVHWVED
ncbi:MAG: hypothetical protein QM635_05165 [Microbacteriaceae bacterium]